MLLELLTYLSVAILAQFLLPSIEAKLVVILTMVIVAAIFVVTERIWIPKLRSWRNFAAGVFTGLIAALFAGLSALVIYSTAKIDDVVIGSAILWRTQVSFSNSEPGGEATPHHYSQELIGKLKVDRPLIYFFHQFAIESRSSSVCESLENGESVLSINNQAVAEVVATTSSVVFETATEEADWFWQILSFFFSLFLDESIEELFEILEGLTMSNQLDLGEGREAAIANHILAEIVSSADTIAWAVIAVTILFSIIMVVFHLWLIWFIKEKAFNNIKTQNS